MTHKVTRGMSRARWATALVLTLAASLTLASCAGSSTTTCNDGKGSDLFCPPSTRCSAALHRCVTAAEEDACAQHVDGDACKLFDAAGTCRGGVCVALFCGDGIVSGPEDCDGGPPAGQTCLDLGFDRGLLGCSEQCTTVTDQCQRFGWKALPAPTTVSLNGVWANHWDDVFVVGTDSGEPECLHWNGAVWSRMEVGGPGLGLNAIWGSAPDDLFAVGSQSVVHFDGVQWTPWSLSTSAYYTFSAVWGSGPGDVYAVAPGNPEGCDGACASPPAGAPEVQVVHWNGVQWGPVDVGGSPSRLVSVWGSGRNDVFMAGGPMIKHWDGSTWSEQAYGEVPVPMGSDPMPSFSALGGSSPTNVFAVGGASDGSRSAIAHFDGTQWSPITWGSLNTEFRAVWSSDPNDALAIGVDDFQSVTRQGVIEHWNGSTWNSMSVGKALWLSSISGADGGVVAVGAPGTVLQWDRVGWSEVSAGPLLATSVWAANPNDAYAVGADVMHWDGKSWSAVEVPVLFGFVWGLSSDDVYLVGDNVISHWDGEAWTKAWGAPTHAVWRSVWGAATDDVYVVGLGGHIAHWDGMTWSRVTANTEGEDLLSVWGSGPEDIYAVGRRRVFHSDGQTWSSVFSPPPGVSLLSIWGSGPNDVYAVGDAGTIVHWDGESWSFMTSGTTERLTVVAGSGPGDVFASNTLELLHLRAGVWERVLLPEGLSVADHGSAGIPPFRGLWVSPTRVFVVGGGTEAHLDRGSVTCQGPERICDDGWDNDCDGLQDGADPDCAGKVVEQCANLADDDGDRLFDCADPDCATFPRCEHP